MALQFDNLDEAAVGGNTAQNHALGAKFGAVTVVELIAMAMALFDSLPPVEFRRQRLILQDAGIVAQAHGTSLGIDGLLLRHQMDHRMRRLQVELARVRSL